MAKDHADYYYVRWSAKAEIDGTEVPIAWLEVHYTINELPEAQLGLTVGRDPMSGEEAAAVDIFLKARPYTNVKIYIKGETEMDSPQSDPGFPFDEDVLVFDGYLEGVNYQSRRTPAGGSVSVSASCVGWLAALGGSVSSTQTNTVKGPGGFDEIANLGPNIGVFDIYNTYGVDATGIISNLWVDFIKEMFLEMTGDDNVWGETDNQSAKVALERMDNVSGLTNDANTALVFPVARAGVSEEVVKEFLLEQIGRVVYSKWREHDMWTVLNIMATEFKFGIVPIIDSAYCAPIFPSIGGAPYKSIGADEYFAISYNANAQANVTRLAMIDIYNSTSNPRDPEVKVSGVIGLYSVDGSLNPGDNSVGLTRQLAAPLWLVASSSIGEYTRISIGGDKLGIPDAVNPTAFSETPDEQYNELYSNYITSQIGDDYAKLYLQSLFFANRNGQMSGRVRLDIAPGSLISVDVINDKFSDSSAQPSKIYAVVPKVVVRVDSGSYGSTGAAETRFMLSHIRSETEHNDDRLTSQRHPIYDTRFVGTKLWIP